MTDPKVPLDFVTYQIEARRTAIYPGEYKQTYPLLGLIGEVGEFCNKYKKVLRDGAEFSRGDAMAELGDILWYLTLTADDFNISMDNVARNNLAKLSGRQARGTLGGSGDER